MKKIHFIGIGGIGMSGIARVLAEMGGFEITGSDISENKKVKELRKLGVKVNIGHREENLPDDADTVVFTAAVKEDNPEIQKAKKLGMEILSRPAMLDRISADKISIGVSGTHGKTTTTSLVSKVLLDAGFDPSFVNGGDLPDLGTNARYGRGDFFVYEACEAFASFLELNPDIEIVTNIDNDHILEFYGSEENLKNAFLNYMKKVPDSGFLVINGDDKPAVEVSEKLSNKRIITYGIAHKNDVQIRRIHLNKMSSSFEVEYKGINLGRFTLNIPGRHNVYNATASLIVAVELGVDLESIKRTFANFKNAERRFQIKVELPSVVVIDDYAHHPTEIKATLKAVKNLKRHTIAVFQPHLYSRTKYLYRDFAEALMLSDVVILSEVYGAREKNDGTSSKLIYDEIKKKMPDKKVFLFHHLEEIPEFLPKILSGKDVVITLGAGDVWRVADELKRKWTEQRA